MMDSGLTGGGGAKVSAAAEPRGALHGGADYAARLCNISKVYPGTARRVNDRINLELKRAEILCLAGENGAGKTTLMKILCGVEQPSEGEIFIRGRQVKIANPLAANRLGIGMVYQHVMLFPDLTVAQNVVMGVEPRVWGIFYDHRKALNQVNAFIKAHHFALEGNTRVNGLTVGQKQQVEILKLLYRDVDILVLDEPTAALTRQETVSLFKTLRALKAAGKSIILITHKLPEIGEIADRVAVMRQGALAGLRETAGIDIKTISRMMIGPETVTDAAVWELLDAGARKPAAVHGTVDTGAQKAAGADKGPGEVLRFDNVTVRRQGQKQPLLDRLSFTVRGGEILGFAGVGGNGLGVLEALLGGFLHPASGAIYHRGKDISRFRASGLRREGLAYVPADRLRVGTAPGATVEENLILNRRREFAPRFFFDQKAARGFTQNLIRRFNISGSWNQTLGTLSGGNIQKLILAREIDQFRDYIVFSEPAWGLDMMAAAAVYREIRRLRDRGAAVLLISTNLDEILFLADRIIVLYRGSAAAELRDTGGIPDIKEKIGAYMLGGTA
ncbi:MAG: ATP-binding cassette domain-containing protein [Treponema sp.]|jgi:simple sugar transport system ATP-binding protein|nr:ATP-binding cassette domain-containing protein [Treponema sp.]